MRMDARRTRTRHQPDASQLSLFDEAGEEAGTRMSPVVDKPAALFVPEESAGSADAVVVEKALVSVPQPLQRVRRWLQERAIQRGCEAAVAGDAELNDPVALAPHSPDADAIPGSTARAQLAACVLGSGSGGNSTVIRCNGQSLLIDAGFGPRTTAERLAQVGVQLADLRAICLTHLDQDHFRPSWIRTIVGLGIRVYLHRWHVSYLNQYSDADELRRADLLRVFDGQAFEPIEGLRVTTVPLPHDDKGTSAFHLEAIAPTPSPRSGGEGWGEGVPCSPDDAESHLHAPPHSSSTDPLTPPSPPADRGRGSRKPAPIDRASGSPRIGYATDLGHVPDALIDLFAGVDLLMLESNYDPHLQLTSSRPAFLKARVMGDHGHLSNEQALDACRRIAAKSPRGNPQKIVLLHRSQQCNTHELVRQTFASEPMFAKCFTVAQQRRHTPWFAVRPLDAIMREQLTMRL